MKTHFIGDKPFVTSSFDGTQILTSLSMPEVATIGKAGCGSRTFTAPLSSPAIHCTMADDCLSQKKQLPQSLPLITNSDLGPKKLTPFIVQLFL